MSPPPPEQLSKQLAGYMRHWREERRLSQEQVADRIDSTLQQWSRWESGTANPTMKNLLLIAQAMDKELPDLIADVWHFRA